ncbi:Cof-type HAD-IIB family hydrolase [Caldibacillus lycopersici]|uniref:Cof-type HAD-IIB family hydrolase n=1 Tax=Perspicuibacillus lycopersici TaxID=1325689 RepID=A0AAE3LN84_9BACI|nr:Cof-type HAD-IIB family hydrolase [Perspicuibacillus lycopersici]MCU9614410.1 Cof-type HAD-IIB family hydrolase [Perspicuibacillus lycopersici]
MKLIALDMDGTLLSEDGTISKDNRDMIYRCQDKGDIVAICSGRSLQDILGILEDAGIDCPIISSNGAHVYDGERTVAEFCMSSIAAKEITERLVNENYYFEIYTHQGVQIFTSGREQLKAEIEKLRKDKADFPVKWAYEQIEIQYNQKGLLYSSTFDHTKIQDLQIYKVFVLSFDRGKLKRLEVSLAENELVSLTTSGWTKLEIAHPEVSKGNGLKILAAHYQIPVENTIAIGDNLNDLPMFKVAGTSIAMGNASDEIKAQCTYTTKCYHENGVAYALEKFVL